MCTQYNHSNGEYVKTSSTGFIIVTNFLIIVFCNPVCVYYYTVVHVFVYVKFCCKKYSIQLSTIIFVLFIQVNDTALNLRDLSYVGLRR